MDTMEENVRRGIAYLDSTRPGWRGLINWDTLKLNSMHLCILGQLDGSFENGRRILAENLNYPGCGDCRELELADAHGFIIWELFDAPYDEIVEMYAELTDMWRRLALVEG